MQIVALSNGNQLVWTFSETLGKPVMPFIEHHLQYEAGCKANGAKVVV